MQPLYKKVRFVFGRDCRVALRAPRNDMPCLLSTRFVHSQKTRKDFAERFRNNSNARSYK
ncbi:MAG: hypothetical protein LBL66_03880 [Clostridiales bacterium]|nr:hypothetical protein [Clostridiales bacterium]